MCFGVRERERNKGSLHFPSFQVLFPLLKATHDSFSKTNLNGARADGCDQQPPVCRRQVSVNRTGNDPYDRYHAVSRVVPVRMGIPQASVW